MISEACGGGFAITGIANATLTLFPLVELKIVWSGPLSSMRRLPFKINQTFVQIKFLDFSVLFLDNNIHLHFNKAYKGKKYQRRVISGIKFLQ